MNDFFSFKIPCGVCKREMVPVRAMRFPGQVLFIGNERCLACGAMNAIDIDIKFRYVSVVNQAKEGLQE